MFIHVKSKAPKEQKNANNAIHNVFSACQPEKAMILQKKFGNRATQNILQKQVIQRKNIVAKKPNQIRQLLPPSVFIWPDVFHQPDLFFPFMFLNDSKNWSGNLWITKDEILLDELIRGGRNGKRLVMHFTMTVRSVSIFPNLNTGQVIIDNFHATIRSYNDQQIILRNEEKMEDEKAYEAAKLLSIHRGQNNNWNSGNKENTEKAMDHMEVKKDEILLNINWDKAKKYIETRIRVHLEKEHKLNNVGAKFE